MVQLHRNYRQVIVYQTLLHLLSTTAVGVSFWLMQLPVFSVILLRLLLSHTEFSLRGHNLTDLTDIYMMDATCEEGNAYSCGTPHFTSLVFLNGDPCSLCPLRFLF